MFPLEVRMSDSTFSYTNNAEETLCDWNLLARSFKLLFKKRKDSTCTRLLMLYNLICIGLRPIENQNQISLLILCQCSKFINITRNFICRYKCNKMFVSATSDSTVCSTCTCLFYFVPLIIVHNVVWSFTFPIYIHTLQIKHV